jgi:hypothetical protein
MRLQTLTGKLPTERPPDPENGSPGTVATADAAKQGHSSDVPRTDPPSKSSAIDRLLAADAVLTVYDGRCLVGVITKHAGTYTAHDSSGRFLGRHVSQRDAMAAIPIGGAS